MCGKSGIAFETDSEYICIYIKAVWETEPSYFFDRFSFHVSGSSTTVLYNQILCDIIHSAMS